VIGLWRNATPKQHQAVMEKIARNASERYGATVTWAIHEPSGEGSEDNWHGHLAMNMRRVTPNGFGPKAREIVDGKTRRLETEWMRRMIEDEINGFLRSVNSDERITHESYRDRGAGRRPHPCSGTWNGSAGKPLRCCGKAGSAAQQRRRRAGGFQKRSA
jgi:hypothetical protein